MLKWVQSETEHVHRNEMMCVRYVRARDEVLLNELADAAITGPHCERRSDARNVASTRQGTQDNAVGTEGDVQSYPRCMADAAVPRWTRISSRKVRGDRKFDTLRNANAI